MICPGGDCDFYRKRTIRSEIYYLLPPQQFTGGTPVEEYSKIKKNVRTDEPDKKYFGRMYNTSSFSTRWICFYIQEINILTRNPPQYDKRTPWSPEALQKSEEWPGKHYTSTGAVLQQRPAGTASCGKRYLSG